MGWASNYARRNVDLAWISLGISDEVGDRFGRNRWMHQHDVGHDNNGGNRRDVADEIEIEVVIEGRVDCGSSIRTKERIAVSGRTYDCFGGDIAGGACPVLDDEWLTEPL